MIILKPLITEKSMKLAGKGTYTFQVALASAKPEIAKEIGRMYNVEVVSVKTLIQKGKVKMQRRVRKSYKGKDVKKAMVELKKGQKLTIFETVPEQEEVVVTRGEESETQIIEKKSRFRDSKVKIEKSVKAPTTQRKVITGK